MMSAFDHFSGKITATALEEVLVPHSGHARKEVIHGPMLGVDTALIDLGNNLGLAMSSDPLSLIPTIGLKASAWLSVHLLANDMATTGFAPQYAQFVLNLPPQLSSENFKEYWHYIHLFCEDIGVAITGGHTGRIEGQNSAISGGGTMFLTAPLDEIITSNHAASGDIIIVTKETALTSSSILAMSFPETVKNKLGTEVYDIACNNFYQTSVLKEAQLAKEILKPKSELKAMHDATEGGILGAIHEMAQASGCGFLIDNDKLPAGNAQKAITDLFEIDHRFCVGAGAMIIAAKQGTEEKLITHLNKNSIKATIVGSMTEKKEGYKLIENGEVVDFIYNGVDPYWGAFFKALKDGLK